MTQRRSLRAAETGWASPYSNKLGGRGEALNNWVLAFEARGFLVFQTGDVKLDEMRGFSLSDRRAPVIVLNAKDHPRARVFTLMHEYAHVMLDIVGVCDPQRVGRQAHDPDERVEVFCNHVAGALLVPSTALLADARVAGQRGREWPEAPRLDADDVEDVDRPARSRVWAPQFGRERASGVGGLEQVRRTLLGGTGTT